MKSILSSIMFLISIQLSSQVDNLSKNTAIHNDLKEKYEAELLKSPNSAIPHWNHANELAKVTFNASKNAPEYFLKALEIDSTNANIYYDFGNYLLEQRDLNNAYYFLNKGLTISPEDIRFKEKLNEIQQFANQAKKYWELRRLPEYTIAKTDRDGMTLNETLNYKNIFRQTKKGKFKYSKLESDFIKDPNSLSPKQMFYFIIGQTQQEFYKPYNFNDEKKMIQLAQNNEIEKAIKFGEEIIKREQLNLLVLKELLYSYRVKEDFKNIKLTETKMTQIFDGFLYSGDGSCENPLVTISTQEEYLISEYLGYQVVKLADSQSRCKDLFTDKLLVKKENDETFLHYNYTPISLWLDANE